MKSGERLVIANEIARLIEARVNNVAQYDYNLQLKCDALEARNVALINEINMLRGDVKVVEPLKRGEWYIGKLSADGSFNPVRPLVV
jgi:hypothetical protein